MIDDRILYTGQLVYKDIDFTFVFDGFELRLIPPKDKRNDIYFNWLMIPTTENTYVPNNLILEESFLLGFCNETSQNIIFLTRPKSCIGNNNTVLIVDVIAYIVCKQKFNHINQIAFNNPEINAIYPINEAYSIKCPVGVDSDGVVTLTTDDFDSTTTQKQFFSVESKEITSYFDISREISLAITKPPLSLNSSLIFEFTPTNDYEFMLRLWYIAKDFLSYLCYRKDVYLPYAKLFTLYNDNRHLEEATLYIVGENKCMRLDDIEKGHYIKQKLIDGYEGQILNDIAAGELYLRHIPESYESGLHKDAAKFVMITTAFEWEFRRNYPSGVSKGESTKNAEKQAEEAIQHLIDNSQGKLKSIYKFLKKLVKSDSLQSEILQINKDYSEIIDIFGQNLYSLNNQPLVYSEIGERLSSQRNHFAHGDLDKEFIDLSLLDLIFLEYIVYAIQLKHYGLETIKIQNAINDLFHCNAI